MEKQLNGENIRYPVPAGSKELYMSIELFPVRFDSYLRVVIIG